MDRSAGYVAVESLRVPEENKRKPASGATTSYLPDVPDPLLGATIADRYQIVRKLGEGGMGTVYLALHTILEKQVALKVLHGEFARKPDLVERFMQEAKAASRIRHENVIDISDFGVSPDGHVYFAMELLHGRDLHDLIARARLAGDVVPWARTKKIFLQICAALSAAHARGIVHRDLKPENVYLVEFLGDPDFVKLLDFGIAKLTDVSSEEGARKLTKTGMLFGTPEYMSPEQARGEQVDHRVDIYAMGCILFQLVTNRVPFESDNFMAVLSQHLTEQPPKIPPQIFDRIGAPRALAGVIEHALVKDRNRRYQTIDELANAVRQVSGEAPVTPRHRPLTAPEPVSREPSGSRVRTQWKGEPKVPEIAIDEPRATRPRSKVPFVVLGVLVLVAGAFAAAFALRSDDKPAPVASSPPPAPAPAPAATAPVTPPPAPPVAQEPPVPAMVEVVLESTPKGAAGLDAETNARLGTTPYRSTIPGSKTARRFKFQLKGYGDSTVELVPDRPQIQFKQVLEKGAHGTTVTKVPDVAIKKPELEPKPEAKPGGEVTKPGDVEKPADTKPAETKPADTKPADTKPADAKPADPPCKDDEYPCLKPMPK